MNQQLDPHVRAIFEQIVTHTPDLGPTPPGEIDARTVDARQHRAALTIAAAAIAIVGVGGAVLVASTSNTSSPGSASPPPAGSTQPLSSIPRPGFDTYPGLASASEQAISPSLDLRAQAAAIAADTVEIVVDGRSFTPPPDAAIAGDGAAQPSLQADWMQDGTEMRWNVYFASDGRDWWVDEVRIYNGQTPGDWLIDGTDRFHTPLGQAYVGDLDMAFAAEEAPGEIRGRLTVSNATMQAFLDWRPGDTIPTIAPQPVDDTLPVVTPVGAD